LQQRHLEGESGGRGQRIGEDLAGAGGLPGREALLQIGTQAGLSREGKGGAHLHAGGALVERLAHAFRVAVSAGQPEGHAQRAQARKVYLVALAVDRLAGGVEQQLAARRRIVSARRGAFDDQPVDAAAGPAQHGGGQGVGADDGQEARPVENGSGPST
jgi:hypothetical protein